MGEQLTESDVKKIKEEIEYRKIVVRKKELEAVKEARAQGDLSENFEYKAAKQDKNRNESRIRYLERMLKNAKIVSDTSKVDEVGINNTVEVYFEDDDETETYRLVTSIRGNSLQGLISIESPLGKAIQGHKVGDRVLVRTNGNDGYYVVIKILTIQQMTATIHCVNINIEEIGNIWITGERIMLGKCIENVRKSVPLVHNITNYVTVNDVANVLLACGGSPIMSDEPEDVKEITSICQGLNINIGTLNKRTIEGMLAAGARANELGHVTLLDPVGAGASGLRTNTAVELMEKVRFDVIRGNISEVKTLAQGSGTTKGVDADVADAVTEENLEEGIAFAKAFAKKAGCIVAITGAIDLVSDGASCYIIRNGRPEMGKITGTGCQLSGMMTAFLAANPEQKLEAAAAAVCTMGLGRRDWMGIYAER